MCIICYIFKKNMFALHIFFSFVWNGTKWLCRCWSCCLLLKMHKTIKSMAMSGLVVHSHLKVRHCRWTHENIYITRHQIESFAVYYRHKHKRKNMQCKFSPILCFHVNIGYFVSKKTSKLTVFTVTNSGQCTESGLGLVNEWDTKMHFGFGFVWTWHYQDGY